MIGLRCVIGDGVTIRNSIVMGADYMETDADMARLAKEGKPRVGIGSGSLIDGAILDKNSRIGRHVQVSKPFGVNDSDTYDPCFVREGICIVTKDGILEDGWSMGKPTNA